MTVDPIRSWQQQLIRVGHPAKFTKALWGSLVEVMDGFERVCDPFAGIGTVHLLAEMAGVPRSVGVELEPEWAYQAIDQGWADGVDRLVVVGDSTRLIELLGRSSVDCIVTSPVYGNRMSDSFDARDRSKRNTYHHQLGRRPTAGSSATMHFGRSGDYEALHRAVWEQCFSVLASGGRMVVNASDFLRTVPLSRLDGQGDYSEVVEISEPRGKARIRMGVVQFHLDCLESAGFVLQDHVRVETPRQRQGQNGAVRVEDESVLVFRKPLTGGVGDAG